MKKIILSVVFVFASFAMVNAKTDENSNEIKNNIDKIQVSCAEVASNFASMAYDSGFSVEDSIAIYDIIMDNCIEKIN
ncbi:MAG: hypothetical protein GZ086_06920 [Gelidibacter sp.]|nr:hypothetical protein [Gelidibacter sp.]